MGKQHRSAQGKMVDVTRINLQNELIPAIGNMRVNARGDQLGPGGKIVKTREQMMDEYYKNNLKKKDDNRHRSDVPQGGKAKTIEKKEKFVPGTIEADAQVAEQTAPEETNEPTGGLAKAIAKNQDKK